MENFQISKSDGGIHIEGFPDALKVIQIDGPRSKRLADLALHKEDIEFAIECLEAINQVPDKSWVIKQSLWRAAVIHFIKCFGISESRFQLDANKIYRGNISALDAFSFFKNLRDKHFIHDENSYAQCISGAILNNGKKAFKIEKIVCFSAIAETLEQENYSNLHLLLQTARDWVIREFDTLCEALTKEMEALPYQDLIVRKSINYQVPKVEEVDRPRS